MRRLALSVFAVCGLALFTACGSSGGYGFASTSGNGSIDAVVFTTDSAQTNDFFVTADGTAPLQINAVGQKGSGPFATVVADAAFTWAGRFVNANDSFATASYLTGPAPAAAKACPDPNKVVGGTPPVPILQQDQNNPLGVPLFVSLPAAQAARTVYIGAVKGVTPPYCLVIVATHVGDGVLGSKTVLVTAGVP
jgi:hypothetical protein